MELAKEKNRTFFVPCILNILYILKILNIAKFWIWLGSQYPGVTQRSEYARMCRDRVLNISRVLNMPGFWIWEESENARVTKGSKYAKMSKFIWIGREYPWIYREVSECYTIHSEVTLQVNGYLFRVQGRTLSKM